LAIHMGNSYLESTGRDEKFPLSETTIIVSHDG